MLSAENLHTIREEGALLLAAFGRDPAAMVPQYPGWTLDDLVYHTAGVHGRTVLICRLLAQERVHAPRCPPDMTVDDWYRQNLAEMLEIFGSSDPGVSVWGFGASPTIGFWERRMVIETGVHRRDAEQALGLEGPLTDHVAVSGLDEFTELWLPFLGEVPTLKVTATDIGRSWVIGPGTEGSEVEGTASEVFLRLMARPSAVSLPTVWADAVDRLAPPPKPDRAPRQDAT